MPSVAISSSVCISTSLLVASLTRSHVTDRNDSRPAAHHVRLSSSTSSSSSSSGSIRRRRDRTLVCMLDGRWFTMAALSSGRFMSDGSAVPTGLRDMASAVLFFMPGICVMRKR